MVAIKNMEMPSCCRKTITLGGTIIDIKLCPFYENCESEYHEIVDFNIKPSDCPLVEIEEPKTGHWIDDEVDSFSKSFGYKKFHCSRCLKVIEGISAKKTDYCPNCGADMREVEE